MSDAVKRVMDELAQHKTSGASPSGLLGEDGIIYDLAVLEAQLRGVPIERTKMAEKANVKALAEGTTGAGAEWIPTELSAQFILDVEENLRLAPLFRVIRMTRGEITLPAAAGDADAVLFPENTDEATSIPEVSISTRDITLTAKRLAARAVTSTEWLDDAPAESLNQLRHKLVRSVARAIENAIINGDDSDTHMDSDVTNATDARKAWKGLRKKALTDSSGNVDFGGTLTVENLLALKKGLGKYGMEPDQCAWIVSAATYNDLLNLKDSDGNPVLLTVDKYGKDATILTGELGRIFGIPVLWSPFIRTDLNASGVYDGSTTDKTVILLVNREAFALGIRLDATVETMRVPPKQIVHFVVVWRGIFQDLYPGDVTAVVGYNVPA